MTKMLEVKVKCNRGKRRPKKTWNKEVVAILKKRNIE